LKKEKEKEKKRGYKTHKKEKGTSPPPEVPHLPFFLK
jgi:hypothetical protein